MQLQRQALPDLEHDVADAQTGGVTPDGGDAQLDDLLIGRVVEVIRSHHTDGHREAWRVVGASWRLAE